jgi:hypothetical protein
VLIHYYRGQNPILGVCCTVVDPPIRLFPNKNSNLTLLEDVNKQVAKCKEQREAGFLNLVNSILNTLPSYQQKAALNGQVDNDAIVDAIADALPTTDATLATDTEKLVRTVSLVDTTTEEPIKKPSMMDSPRTRIQDLGTAAMKTLHRTDFAMEHYTDLKNGAYALWSELSAVKIQKAVGKRSKKQSQGVVMGASAPQVCRPSFRGANTD